MERDGLVEGRIALVTGAGSGIGRATALLFGSEGAGGVVVSDVDGTAARETAQMIADRGQRAVAVAADVSKVDDVDRMIHTAIERYGRLDCAVNNAGVRGRMSPLADYVDDDWRRVLSVNLDGVFHCMRAEINAMRAGGGGGSIVNISSGTTADPTPGLSAYVASKFGVLGLTRAVAGETARENIRINAVLPGSTRTAMFEEYLSLDPTVEARVLASMPQGRLGRPDELAQAIVWLCSDRSSFVNAVCLLVDGGTHSFAHRPRPQAEREIPNG